MVRGLSGAEKTEVGQEPQPAAVGSRLTRTAGVLIAALGAALLVGGAVVGASVRPTADDWCLASTTKISGIGGMVGWFYHQINGRVANAFISGVVFSHGPRGPELLPGLIAVTLPLGIFLALHLAGRMAGVRVGAALNLAVSTTLSVLVLFAGPVTYQVFFWAAGSISHTVPAVLAIWVLVLVLLAEFRSSSRLRAVAVVGCVGIGFVIGSLSEAFVAVSGLYVTAGALMLWRVARSGRLPWAIWYCLGWLAGMAAGFLLLLTSPGRADRQARPIDQPGMLSVAGVKDALDQFGSAWSVLLHQPAFFAAVGVGMIVGLSLPVPRDGSGLPDRVPGTPRNAVVLAMWAFVLIVFASFAVIVELRVGYGPNGWTYERVWENFMVPFVATLALYGLLFGMWLRRTLRVWPAAITVVVAGALCAAALGVLVPSLHSLSQDVVARRAAWDVQDAKIRRHAAAGEKVVSYTPTRIANMTEPFTYLVYQQDWVAHCVADYYGVDAIRPSRKWLRSPASATYRMYHRIHSSVVGR